MDTTIFQCLERPPLYAQSATSFWQDAYISKQLLKAHLDPHFEGASRPLEFLEQSTAWIKTVIPPANHHHLLDVGCGPGLYAERFCTAGYQVTAIDFSKRSINYAKRSARRQGLQIAYLHHNYLALEMNSLFDAATLIYCDYGALSIDNRRTVLRNIYQSLRPGGKLVLDVFSLATFNQFQELNTWEACPAGGFWSADSYVALKACAKYQNDVTLEHIVVICNGAPRTFYIWNCCFSIDSLTSEAKLAGFRPLAVFGDIAGAPYTNDSPTIAILLEK